MAGKLIVGLVPADRFRCITCGEIEQEGLSVAAPTPGKQSDPMFLWICADCCVSLALETWERFTENFTDAFDTTASDRVLERLADLAAQTEHIGAFLQNFIRVPEQVEQLHSSMQVNGATVEPPPEFADDAPAGVLPYRCKGCGEHPVNCKCVFTLTEKQDGEA